MSPRCPAFSNSRTRRGEALAGQTAVGQQELGGLDGGVGAERRGSRGRAGGHDAQRLIADVSDALAAAGKQKPRSNGKIRLDTKRFSGLCGALVKRADDASAYFSVPDKKLQKTWSGSLNGIARQGWVCQDAMTRGDDDPYKTETVRSRAFSQALEEILKAVGRLTTILDRMTDAATGST